MSVQLILPLEPGSLRCCRCLRDRHDDGSHVTWRCVQCHETVCRGCTLTDPASLHRTYYDETFCSQACKDAWDEAILGAMAMREVMES